MFAYGGKLYDVDNGSARFIKTGVSKFLALDSNNLAIMTYAKKMVLANIRGLEIEIVHTFTISLTNLDRVDDQTILGLSQFDNLHKISLIDFSQVLVNNLAVKRFTLHNSTLLMIDLQKRLWIQKLSNLSPHLTPIFNVEKIVSNSSDVIMLINEDHKLTVHTWNPTSQQLSRLTSLPMADIGRFREHLITLDTDGILRQYRSPNYLSLISIGCLTRVIIEARDHMIIVTNDGSFKLLATDDNNHIGVLPLEYTPVREA